MPEKISRQTRSRMMGSIRGKNTRPEMEVRKILHGLGFRFRLHHRDLPGRPDIVLPRHRLAIFVNGCFWHRHTKCRYATCPKSNIRFWTRKFISNVQRDEVALARLKETGWRTLVVWECSLKSDSSRKSLPGKIRTAVVSNRMAAQIPRASSHDTHQ